MTTLAESPFLADEMLSAPWVWLNADQRYQDLGLTEFRGDGVGPQGRLFNYENVPGYASANELPAAFVAQDDVGSDDGPLRHELVIRTRIGVCYANSGTEKTARRDCLRAITQMLVILAPDSQRRVNTASNSAVDAVTVRGGPIIPLIRENENQPWAFTASLDVTLSKRLTG